MVQNPPVGRQSDIDHVLHAIREVMANLEDRAARAHALEDLVWTAVIATTFMFYQLVWWDPGLYWELLGPFVGLAWMVPVSAGWLAHEVLAPQADRGRDDAVTVRGGSFGKTVAVASIVAIGPVVAVVQFLGEYGRIPGVVLFLVALMKMTERPREDASPAARLAGVIMVAATGLLLTVVPLSSAFVLAVVAYVAGIGGFAMLDYLRSR